MENIIEPSVSFDFQKLLLVKPTIIPGGNYFIRFINDKNVLYIMTPKCKTKQGIVKNNKRSYVDLMFTNENQDFIQWLENLESYCQQCIFNNREKWFEGELEMNDIENYFTSPIKIYKSGKYYIVRAYLANVLGKPTVKIYDEQENEVDAQTITDETTIISILEIQGIKCSVRSFQIEIELKQMMVLKPSKLFESCIIKSRIQTPTDMLQPIVVENQSSDSTTIMDDYQNNTKQKTNTQTGVKEEHEINKEIKSDTGGSEITRDITTIDKQTNISNNTKNKDTNNEDINKKISDINTKNDYDNQTNQISMLSSTFDEEKQLNTGSNLISEDNSINNTITDSFKENTFFDTIQEVEFNLEEIPENDTIQIKKRNDVYYEMYKEARKKAKTARDLALSAYLEAKQIKNTYMLDDINDSDDSDLDISDDFEDDS